MNKNHDKFGRFSSGSGLRKGATVRVIVRNSATGAVVRSSGSTKVKSVVKDHIGYGKNPATGKHWDAGRVVNGTTFTRTPSGHTTMRVETTKINRNHANETKAALKEARANHGVGPGLRQAKMDASNAAVRAQMQRNPHEPKGHETHTILKKGPATTRERMAANKRSENWAAGRANSSAHAGYMDLAVKHRKAYNAAKEALTPKKASPARIKDVKTALKTARQHKEINKLYKQLGLKPGKEK